jgi:hypothetical protein
MTNSLNVTSAAVLAALLNGRQYRNELSREEKAAAKAAGLVVVTGYSDDGVSFFGAIDDEAGAGNGTQIRLTNKGLLVSQCDCSDCPYFKKLQAQASSITVRCGVEGFDWSFETAIPHVTFDVVDEDNGFARAIVFSLADVPAI